MESDLIDSTVASASADPNSDVDSVYTPLAAATAELHLRWNDRELVRRMDDYFENDIPGLLQVEPVALSFPHVATPNFWSGEFVRKSRSAGLRPVILEFQDDVFVTVNLDKLALANMRLCVGTRKNGTDRIWRNQKIIKFDANLEGTPLKLLRTLWGEPLIDFHHRAFRQILPDVEIHDNSPWLQRNTSTVHQRYEKFMALLIRNGVLFENFLNTKSERQFTDSVVIPAFHAAHRKFGLRPLIVRIVPRVEEEDRGWWGYPQAALSQLPAS